MNWSCCCHVLLLSWGLDLVRAQTCPVDDTPSDALGPFYLSNAPMTTRLARDNQLANLDNVLHVEGRVYGNDCTPMDSILVEPWYAGDPTENDGDSYSVAGSDLVYRGKLYTDECGYYSFTQTYPILYTGRPIRHVHFRFMDGLLVTQMYFEGDIPAGYNPDASQVVSVATEVGGSRRAVFDVYLDTPGTSNFEACNLTSPVNEVQPPAPTPAEIEPTASPVQWTEQDKTMLLSPAPAMEIVPASAIGPASRASTSWTGLFVTFGFVALAWDF
jgi:protocatechuate 3,4-dioxygenase beta subunit